MVKPLGPSPSKGGRTEFQAARARGSFRAIAGRDSGSRRQLFKNSVTIALNCSGACSNIQ
jgi:hypothetical protein